MARQKNDQNFITIIIQDAITERRVHATFHKYIQQQKKREKIITGKIDIHTGRMTQRNNNT